MPLGIGLQLGDLRGQLAAHRDQFGDQHPECGVFGPLVLRQNFFDDGAEVFGHTRVLQHRARSVLDLRAHRANSYQDGRAGVG